MKQKPRKFCNGFYPTSETDLEEMADKERNSSANQDTVDTVHRLSQILSDLKSDQKLSASDEEREESDLLGVIRDEIECEEFLLKTLYTGVDTVKIYTVSQWSKHKITQQLNQYKVNTENLRNKQNNRTSFFRVHDRKCVLYLMTSDNNIPEVIKYLVNLTVNKLAN